MVKANKRQCTKFDLDGKKTYRNIQLIAVGPIPGLDIF